jgi:hypothetical protein
MIEIILPVKGEGGKYMISNLGYVQSISVDKERHWKRGRVLRILADNINSRGYKVVGLKKRKRMLLHRLVAEHFIQNPNNYPCVNHKDGNKLNNCVDNLEWCTPAMNIKHAWDTGLKKDFGENCSYSKLKDVDVLFIKKTMKEYPNTRHRVLANRFGVSRSTISKIMRRINWKHI